MKGLILVIPAMLFLQVKSCSDSDDSEWQRDTSEEATQDSENEGEEIEDMSEEMSIDFCEEPPLHINSEVCDDSTDRMLPRAEAGDYLCVGKDNCYRTSGSPGENSGCPNTCSCLCVCDVCYQNSCTMVGGCTEPPVYK